MGKSLSYRFAATMLGILICGASMAQSVSQIKASGAYLYGEGKAETISEADNIALAEISRQISVEVKSAFTSKERENLTGSSFTSESDYQNIINTYSSATLTAAHRIIEKDEPDAVVFRYILKSEVDRIFKARTDKALEFVRLAERALEDVRIDDALRYYYWSLCLVKSLMRPNEARATVNVGADAEEVLLITFLPTRIEQILSGLSLSAKRVENDECRLAALYNGVPVRSMDYSYFDGMDYGGTYSLQDGHGILELRPGYIDKFVTVKIEYEFAGLAVTDTEVKNVLSAQKKSFFKNSSIRVSIKDNAKNTKVVRKMDNIVETASKSTELVMQKNTDDYIGIVLGIADDVKKARLDSTKRHFTDEGWKDFSDILGYGRILVADNQSLTCYQDAGGVVCRGLSCNFKFGNSRIFNETVSFIFDSADKISHVSLGLGKMASEEIMKQTTWGEDSRKKIVSFLEDYRTAYALKDIGYMENVFDDNAVIIVGNKLKSAPGLTDKALQNNSYVQLTRYSKKEFLARLKSSFLSKEYINLHFSDTQIMKLSGERYGIQLKQDYYSSNYGDSGYLYLLVDFTDPVQPIIHVRTWQPDPDPVFGVIGPGSF